MKQILLSLFLVLATFTHPAIAGSFSENDIVGTVLAVEGIATATPEGERPGPVTLGMAVHPGDIIATGPRARVFIQMIDNTELTLGEKSELTVDDYAFNDKDDTDNHAVYSILKGTFLYVSGLIAQKPNPQVTVNIPHGSIGIRGTKFFGGMVNDDYNVIVGEGQVVVDTGAGRATLARGQGTILRGKGISPGPVKTLPADIVNIAVKNIALKNPAVIGQRMKENMQQNLILRQTHRAIIEEKAEQRILEQQKENGTTDKERKRLQELRREKEERMGVPSASEDKTPAATTADPDSRNPVMPRQSVEPLSKTLGITATDPGNSGIVRATPLRNNTPENTTQPTQALTATESLRNVTNDTVQTRTESTTETVKTATDKAADRVEKTVKTTTQKTTERTTGSVKSLLAE